MTDGLASLKHDPVLSVFLSDNIDTSQFASTVLGNSTAATSAHALSGGIQQLELVLRTEIFARHEELLLQLGGYVALLCAQALLPNALTFRVH